MNKKYEPKQFNIGELKGLSKESIEEHFKLYEGYIKHTNLILDELDSEKQEEKSEKQKYADSEMQRRLGFEFDGMKNHAQISANKYNAFAGIRIFNNKSTRP